MQALVTPLTLIDNTIRHSPCYGIALSVGAAVVVIGNVVTDSALDGMNLDDVEATTLQGNVILRSGGDGIHLGLVAASASVEHNRVDRNGDDGIDVDFGGPILIGNHTWFNGDLGIEAVQGVTGSANWAKHNGDATQCARSPCAARRVGRS